jgi:hypothetical protein
LPKLSSIQTFEHIEFAYNTRNSPKLSNEIGEGTVINNNDEDYSLRVDTASPGFNSNTYISNGSCYHRDEEDRDSNGSCYHNDEEDRDSEDEEEDCNEY